MRYLFALIVASVLPASVTYAGHETGHGGGGYICKDSSGNTSVRLVDLEEADLRQFMGYQKIKRTNVPIESQVATAVQRLATIDFTFAQNVEGELRYIQNHYTDVPKGWTVNKPNDVNADLAPTECPLDGVATYWDEWKVLWIKMNYYTHMFSETDRAALFIHEAVYKVLRGAPWKDTDSVRTRKIVGVLFSEEVDFQKDNQLIKNLINQIN